MPCTKCGNSINGEVSVRELRIIKLKCLANTYYNNSNLLCKYTLSDWRAI